MTTASRGNKKNKKTHLHRSNTAVDVVTEWMSGDQDSVTLNSISVLPSHNPQGGVIFDRSHFTLGLRNIAKLRNDSAKAFPNVVITSWCPLYKLKKVNKTMGEGAIAKFYERHRKIERNIFGMWGRGHAKFTLKGTTWILRKSLWARNTNLVSAFAKCI